MKKITKVLLSLLSLGIFPALSFAQNFGTPPLEVTGLTGTPGDTYIDLSWDEGVDSDSEEDGGAGVIVGYNIYYGTSSVQEDGSTYDETKTVSSRTSYSLEGLSPGETYYIAITALDDDGNESETYSREIKVNMKGGESEVVSIESPRLLSARQISETEIEAIFSQAVKAEKNKETFLVESQKTGRKVAIQDVTIESDIVTLTIEAGALEGETKYSITPTSAIRNRKGVSVEPGGANTLSFVAIQYTEYYGPEEAPQEEPTPEEPTKTTEPEPEQESAPIDATIERVETVEEPDDAFVLTGDITPPADATELEISTRDTEATGMASFTWIPSSDEDNDFAEQVLYIREENSPWEPGIFLPIDANRAEIEVELNTTYEVKITSIDTNSNESYGATETFTTPNPTLAQTGPGINIFAVLSLIAGLFMFRSALKKD